MTALYDNEELLIDYNTWRVVSLNHGDQKYSVILERLNYEQSSRFLPDGNEISFTDHGVWETVDFILRIRDVNMVSTAANQLLPSAQCKHCNKTIVNPSIEDKWVDPYIDVASPTYYDICPSNAGDPAVHEPLT